LSAAQFPRAPLLYSLYLSLPSSLFCCKTEVAAKL
jgi:hypothetical protein